MEKGLETSWNYFMGVNKFQKFLGAWKGTRKKEFHVEKVRSGNWQQVENLVSMVYHVV